MLTGADGLPNVGCFACVALTLPRLLLQQQLKLWQAGQLINA
jgi:hypothetical protein